MKNKVSKSFGYDLVFRGMLTDKSMRLEIFERQLSFYTYLHVTKSDIKKGIEYGFNTKVLKVRTMREKPYKRGKIKINEMKKVIVKVENIDFEIFRSNIEGVK
jgi:ribosomal protein L23